MPQRSRGASSSMVARAMFATATSALGSSWRSASAAQAPISTPLTRAVRRLSGPVGVARKLERVGLVTPLESVREELDEDGARGFAVGRRNADGDAPQPAQRKTLLSFSKRPSLSR